MKITDYMKKTTTIPPNEIISDISRLFSSALKSDSFPSDNPIPRDLNAVSLGHADIVNAQRIELAALSKGYDRALWINAPDAAFLGLKPKDNPIPFVYRENQKLNVQYVYLVDSFTEQSLNNLYAFNDPNPDHENGNHRAVGKLAQKVLYAIANYDTGSIDKTTRAQAVKQYRSNTAPGSPDFSNAQTIYKSYSAAIAPAARPAFDYFRKYHAQQITALPILREGVDKDPALKKSFRFLSDNPEQALKTAYYSRLFSSRVCCPNLSIQKSQGFTPAVSSVPLVRKDTPIEEFLGIGG
jgi:hypothetical protein